MKSNWSRCNFFVLLNAKVLYDHWPLPRSQYGQQYEVGKRTYYLCIYIFKALAFQQHWYSLHIVATIATPCWSQEKKIASTTILHAWSVKACILSWYASVLSAATVVPRVFCSRRAIWSWTDQAATFVMTNAKVTDVRWSLPCGHHGQQYEVETRTYYLCTNIP